MQEAPNPPAFENFEYDAPGNSPQELRRALANRLLYSVGKDPATADSDDWYSALALVTRDRLVERWMDTTRRQYEQHVKRVYYLSMEFLVGRALTNSLMATGLYDEVATALKAMGLDIEETREQELDAALGNGGLGRLAACFLDSMATLGLPAFGYGLRYEYGMFEQRIHDGRQTEEPSDWLRNGNPWEFHRPEVRFEVGFGGRVVMDGPGRRWAPAEILQATAYDFIVGGYATRRVAVLRQWQAAPSQPIDFAAFSRGDYAGAGAATLDA